LQDLTFFQSASSDERKQWIFRRVKDIVRHAIANVPFYESYYAEHGFRLDELESFDDISRVPIINKAALQEYELKSRSADVGARYLVNTGGTSGQTLAFYVHADQVGNEWAHMHTIWGRLGYKPSCLKLMFGGRSDVEEGIRYDFLRHSIAVDIYEDFGVIATKLKGLLARNEIRYLHGYPSALYEFALACREREPELLAVLARGLRGAFLGSEYPMPRYRRVIERVFDIPTVSWYGHSERCILAYEKEVPFEYYPFQTYGFAEVVTTEDGEDSLAGTSYYNLASPLIRYDTGDHVTSFNREGSMLASFQIDHGRSGQFILDRDRKNIPLTGLIFGRHHTLFNYCSHIQVYQSKPGEAVILFVPLNKDHLLRPQEHFDSQNVNIRFEFELLEHPVRTASGKVNLLVTERDLQRHELHLDADHL
jgi:phenylacetate-CoA ligase